MKKIFFLVTLSVSIILNIGLVYLFFIKGETIKSTDNRTAIIMSKDNKAFVLKEMRDFLESVQQINEGILNNNSQLIIDAGKKSGGSVIERAPKGLMKSLPSGFKSFGFSTHKIFDDFSSITQENYDKNNTQQQLNKLLNNCISCHRSYKIEVKD